MWGFFFFFFFLQVHWLLVVCLICLPNVNIVIVAVMNGHNNYYLNILCFALSCCVVLLPQEAFLMHCVMVWKHPNNNRICHYSNSQLPKSLAY